jgi:hypothetical protein
MKNILGWMFFVVIGIVCQLVNAEDTLGTMGTALSTPGADAPLTASPAGASKAKGNRPNKPKIVYVCPMDGYTSDKPGACPKCGMDLEKQTKPGEKTGKKGGSAESKKEDGENPSSSFDLAKYGKGEKAKVCPVSGDKIKPGEGVETKLSNGKKIMLCCPQCKKPVEKDLKTYESLMYD